MSKKWTYIQEWSSGCEIIKIMQHENGVVARTGDNWVRYWPAGSSIAAHAEPKDGPGYTTLAAASRSRTIAR